MEEQSRRVMPGQTVLGVLLLVMSGALLAVDVGMTAVAPNAGRSLPAPADVELASTTRIADVTTPAPQRITSACNLCDGSHSRITSKTRKRATRAELHAYVRASHALPASHRSPSVVSTQSTVRRGQSILVRRIHALGAPTPEPIDDSIPELALIAGSTGAVSHLPAVHTEQHLALRAISANIPLSLVPRDGAATAHKRFARSAVQGAQYFVVQADALQIHGFRLTSVVTRKRGRDRLVVQLIARVPAGTLVEYDVVRRNGIGYVLEERKDRMVAATDALHAARK